MSEIETADDGREDAGGVGGLGSQISEVRCDEADRKFDRRVLDPLFKK